MIHFYYLDCKDPIRSPDWEPAWAKEYRSPSFMEPDDPSQEDWQASLREQQNFSRGLDL